MNNATAAINGSDRSKAHEMTCHPPRRRESVAPFGIAKAAEQDGGHHKEVAGKRAPSVLEKGVARDRSPSKAREQPEHWLGLLTAAQHAEDCSRKRQKADEDNGVRGRDVLERQRRQQREANNHAQRDDAKRGEVAPRGPYLPQQGKESRTKERRDHRAGRSQEQRREVADRGARRRQRAAEDHDPHKAAAPPLRCPVHVASLSRERPVGSGPRVNRDSAVQSDRNCIDASGSTVVGKKVAHMEATRTGEVMAAIRARVASRALLAGDRLPSIRSFAAAMGVSASTIVEAYDRLAADGLIRARRGSGFYVARSGLPPVAFTEAGAGRDHAVDPFWVSRQSLDAEPAAMKPGCGWLPADWMPHAALRRAVRTLARAEDAVLTDCGSRRGSSALRRLLLGRFAEEGIEVAPEQLLLTASGTQAIDLICRLLLRVGDTVLVDDPCYFNFRALLRRTRSRLLACRTRPQAPMCQPSRSR